jgi:hypothetical protein
MGRLIFFAPLGLFFAEADALVAATADESAPEIVRTSVL